MQSRVLALGIFPFDILPKGWFVAYLAFVVLLPVLILGLIALRLRLSAWRLPQHSPVDPATLPGEIRRNIQPWLGRLGFLGFATQGCTRTRDEQDRECYVWRMVHGNDRCVALLKAVVLSPDSRPSLELKLLSFLPDGSVVVTADRRSAFLPAAHWHALHRKFVTLQDQVDLHRSRMEGLAPVMPPPAALPERLAAEEKAQLDALIASGQYTPFLTGESPGARPAFAALPKLACRGFAALFTGSAFASGRRRDVASATKQKDPEEDIPVAEGKMTPEDLVEETLQRYRARTASKPTGKYYVTRIFLTLVTVSGMLFIFGRDGGLVHAVLTTLGLMAIHEFGHWVMMKLFGYQGMGRFFIPFLSPLDRGRKLHAPAWQQLAVILAGPLPGLLVGMAVLITGYFVPALPPLVPEIGAMAVVLNAFHLLPFLPLDGGKVVDLLVFRDLPILRPLFTLASAIAVFLASIFSGPGGRVLRYVAFTMIAGIAWDIKMIKVVRGGRRLGWADAEDEDETLRRIFKGIREEGNDEFFRDANWPKQIEVLLTEVMRKRPGFLMRATGGALYGGAFVLPFVLVIGVLSITYFGLFGRLGADLEAGAEYQKEFPYKTAALTEAQTVPVEDAIELTYTSTDEDLESSLPSGEALGKVGAEISPQLLPVLDHLNWQHAGLVYHQGGLFDRELSVWFEVLCSKLEAAREANSHAEALVRAETVLHAVTSMEPALTQGDREIFRDAELRALAVIERLAAGGKLDATALQRLDSRIGLLNKAPLPEVENKLLVDGWSEARMARVMKLTADEEGPAAKEDPSAGWKNIYQLVGDGIGDLGHIRDRPVCFALAAEWKKSRRVGMLPEQLAGAENISAREAEYILNFCDGHTRIMWRRLVTLSALRLEAHRVKKGQLPNMWKHTVPGGAIVTLDLNSGPVLRLTDRREESMKLPAWVSKPGASRSPLGYDCPLFGAPELSKK